MELERIESNEVVYKVKEKTITVMRETAQDAEINFVAVLEKLAEILQTNEAKEVSDE